MAFENAKELEQNNLKKGILNKVEEEDVAEEIIENINSNNVTTE